MNRVQATWRGLHLLHRLRALRAGCVTALTAGVLSLGMMPGVSVAEIPLYKTGPDEDSSFLRFVNGTEVTLQVSSAESESKVTLDAAHPASEFYQVPANKDIKGKFLGPKSQSDVAVKVKPGEFASAVAIQDGDALKQVLLREEPDDFNALKASISLYNVDPACAVGGLQVAGRPTRLFESVAVSTLQRRSINPVKLSVQLLCDGKPVGAVLDLGQLEGGQRYTVFAVPGKAGSRIFLAVDAVFH